FAIVHRELPDRATGEMSLGDLIYADHICREILSPNDRRLAASFHAPEDMMLMFMRMMQDQFHDQIGPDYFVRRLSVCMRAVQIAQDEGVDFNAAFLHRYGFTYDDMCFLCFAISGQCSTSKPGFITSNSDEGFLGIDRVTLNAFFRE